MSEAAVRRAADDPVVGERVRVCDVKESTPGAYEHDGAGWYWGTVLEVRRYVGWAKNMAGNAVETMAGDFLVECAPGARHVCDRRQLRRGSQYMTPKEGEAVMDRLAQEQNA